MLYQSVHVLKSPRNVPQEEIRVSVKTARATFPSVKDKASLSVCIPDNVKFVVIRPWLTPRIILSMAPEYPIGHPERQEAPAQVHNISEISSVAAAAFEGHSPEDALACKRSIRIWVSGFDFGQSVSNEISSVAAAAFEGHSPEDALACKRSIRIWVSGFDFGQSVSDEISSVAAAAFERRPGNHNCSD
jgi:hypothetical protein